MQVVPIACLEDNYAYLVVDEASSVAFVVDPSDDAPVLSVVEAKRLRPSAVLCTHHHADHVRGLGGLVRRFPGMRVYAHERDRTRIAEVTQTVVDGDTVQIGPMVVRAIHVPGHTMGAVAWHMGDVLFTGDTLFIGGCGRVFEGTVEMLWNSVDGKIGSLDDATRIYCGHEYTVNNLRFAKHVEPENADIAMALAEAIAKSKQGLPTVGAFLATERKTNPFLRCGLPSVRQYARAHGESECEPERVFALLREHKNVFKS